MASSESQQNAKGLKCIWVWIKGCVDRAIGTAKDAKKLGEEDPRRIVHSIKVGLAITLVSLFYYFDFSYDGFGVNAMWAVMTVVVVFEFSVGATLGKGVNRAIATLLGGALGVAAHRLASLTGERIECFMLQISVFSIASLVTFIRFFPKMKARYDYGLLIFILTFSLISVSGYREEEILKMAHRRLSTILIGGFAAIIICIFICPVWAGQDYHKLIAANIEKLGIFLQGFEQEYFKEGNEKKVPSLGEYKSVLNSKGMEDTLVNFAKWEPRHGKFRYRQPWDQYLKVGSLTRECAYKIDALNACLNSDLQTPLEMRARIKEPLAMMSSNCSCALKELAIGINTMTRSSSSDSHILTAKSAAKKLKSMLKTNLWADADLIDIIPLLTIASLVIEIVSCTADLADSVHDLASQSKFKMPDERKIKKQTSLERVTRIGSIRSHSFSISVE